jgi:hypothetical protein
MRQIEAIDLIGSAQACVKRALPRRYYGALAWCAIALIGNVSFSIADEALFLVRLAHFAFRQPILASSWVHVGTAIVRRSLTNWCRWWR